MRIKICRTDAQEKEGFLKEALELMNIFGLIVRKK